MVYPLTPHFYIVKQGFTGVYIFSYFALKYRLWESLEPPHSINVLSKNKKNITNFHLKIIFCTFENCSILHEHVFVIQRVSCLLFEMTNSGTVKVAYVFFSVE